MAAEAAVTEELRALRARVPQVGGALAATVDGFVLAEDLARAQDGRRPEAEPLAALTAAALGLAFRMNEATGRGAFRELLLHGELGYVATYAAGPTAVLTLLADDRINVGRLHLEGRRAAGRIGALLAEPRSFPAEHSAAEPPAPSDSRPQLERRRLPLERRRRNAPAPPAPEDPARRTTE
ncbi:roadblock/LC7 domain-containing protein [Streptomyces smyrnaeus]|uniref:Roadblock/LC7 domain-containing protein n=1 Tax=Streptomyces smyrnaeus TaxID=1387713 RepID=A0ABS3Y6W7_9ACTN|nr:roadblock/LC7 domain-containing protein [Streptomyces smyrnaeus]MBO8203398.1 roadblock/LC7 domain-containing protein [Streptomyces smyrnaeus]